ncbi:hypothetical protein SUGI_0886780 [Cryptomeria japonica]|uniref:probable CoA ligase CCL5 n=1 Tax=Cryptomeria japonica TaxID=3369 RepID=UPI002414ADA7|nr:probable CoA ligase CCL5 [Cryptomeria japonica]GLJ42765.1 hypothetical protein SUGI_0886780 [Cryptomeria japonica]
MASDLNPSSGFSMATGIYYSKRDPIPIPPPHQHLDLTTYVFSHPHNTEIAIIDAQSNAQLSYRTLRHNVRALATGLQRLGIRKRDVVLIILPNIIHVPSIYLAIVSIGAILTTANPLNTEIEIRKQVADSNPVLAFAAPEFAHKARAAKLPVVLTQSTNLTANDSEYVATLHELFQSDVNNFQPVDIQQEDTATLLYSSGTTGKSKGVVATHRNHIAMVAGFVNSIDTQNIITLCTMPLFHVYGFFYSVSSVATGTKLVLMAKFDFAQMLANVERYKVTSLPVAPPIFVALTKSPIVTKYDLSSLKRIGSGGAPLGKETIDEFMALFPNIEVSQGYGLTESSGAVTFTSTGEEKKKYGTAGLLAANVEAKIVDVVSKKALPPNQRGELWLRGPTIMKGYFSNDEATATTLDSEGWLKTGDLCYFDEEGFLFVVDRIKELIKYKGYQVAPAELEELLLSNPEISDAAVIPYPDKEAGQIPMSFIVRKAGSKLNEEDVKSFVSKQVAPYKKIRRVAFVTSIPKSASGKILRKDLIQQTVTSSNL